MKNIRVFALPAAFIAASATAQPAQSYLVINNTNVRLMCSTRVPNGIWQNWFEMLPAQNWSAASPSPQLEFQCQPPVAQLSYILRPGTRYSLLQTGAEFTLVEVAGH